jgi:tetratricopeptide (TPR) repeat protein
LTRAWAGQSETTGAGPEARQGLPAIPGYELLEEVGRGGMGVVYKARHVALDRLVALKMVLSGEFAGELERARFRTEAQAAARLSHPNVVQVYEVGEHRGHPYLALEYVGGGSLAEQLRLGPLPPHRAAEVVEVLAGAVQAAHDQGIVHRDLKPANILLQMDKETRREGDKERGRQGDKEKEPSSVSSSPCLLVSLSSAVPKIADFGLAKRLDVETATQSGAVMGTPAYMAPEQAAGKGKEVGPSADVYALGAILYECLTGRPPFQAATPLDTIFQVLSSEPVPPRRLRPGVPRDLETVCLCCLEKEPHKRYPSAGALADDLKRWLAGEPIRVRPVGGAGRLWRWCRRRPAVAALLLALLLSLLAGGGAIAYLLRTRPARNTEADVALLMIRGRRHLQQKEHDQALAAFDAVLRLDPSNALAHAERANACMGLGRPDEALAECFAAMKSDPRLVGKFLEWARAGTDEGRHEDVVVSCTAVLRIVDPKQEHHRSGPVADNSPLKEAVTRTADAYLIRSNAHTMLNHWDAAADDFARYAALQRDTPQMTLPFNDACRLLGKRDLESYRKVCAQAIRRVPELSAAEDIYLVARMCLLSDQSGVDPLECLRLAERAVQGEPSPWRLHTLGLAHYRAGQYDLAIRRLQEASRTPVGQPAMTPNNWLVLAMACHRKGQHGVARHWLDAAVRRGVPCMHPYERMAYQIHRREAEALVERRK